MRKLSVAICIPAYNEEKNIGYLLRAILAQKTKDFTLEKIIVASDGSSDKTVEIIRKIKDKRILLISGKKRIGQPARQNQMVRLCSSDIFVLLEADTLPANNQFLYNLIYPFILDKDKKLGLTYGERITLKHRNFFESVMNYSFLLKKRLLKVVNDKHNLYLFGGQSGRAICRILFKKMKWRDDLPEDTYSYLKCLSSGYKIKYCQKALIYFRFVTNFKDYCRQSKKYLQGRDSLSKYIGNKKINDHYLISFRVYISFIAIEIVKHPLKLITYISILIISRIINWRRPDLNPYWEIYTSTKTLITPNSGLSENE